MNVTIVVEAIPPYCGGGEQVAWVHAKEMGRTARVSILTFGDAFGRESRSGIDIRYVPKVARNLSWYSTFGRRLLNKCVDETNPSVIHCHMPSVLSAFIEPRGRLFVSTLHDGVPENERTRIGQKSRAENLKFRLLRKINLKKSDRITCVSQHNLAFTTSRYPKFADKCSFIPNPIDERFFKPVIDLNHGYVLNFGRQIALKVSPLLDAARLLPEQEFLFVGTGDMVREHGLPNVRFLGFSPSVEEYIDRAALCVFPSLSENFPLVGLEAMARGKAVIATKRGFSEYIVHMQNGMLLESTDPRELRRAISLLMNDHELRARLGKNARRTAEQYRPHAIVEQYHALYVEALAGKARSPRC